MGKDAAYCMIGALFFLFIYVGVPLIFVFTSNESKDPEFSVIDTTITIFNLTSDDRLLWVFNVVHRAYNPDTKYAQTYSNQEVSVRTGNHHPIADDWILGFRQDPLNSTLWGTEAVALYKQLERKTAAELREDVAKGVGSVNVYLSGWLGGKIFQVKCKNVMVSFSKSTASFPKINCKVTAYYPNDGNPV